MFSWHREISSATINKWRENKVRSITAVANTVYGGVFNWQLRSNFVCNFARGPFTKKMSQMNLIPTHILPRAKSFIRLMHRSIA